MTEHERLEQAERACFCVLSRTQTDPVFARLMVGTAAYWLLCAVEAAHDGVPVETVLKRHHIEALR